MVDVLRMHFNDQMRFQIPAMISHAAAAETAFFKAQLLLAGRSKKIASPGKQN